MERIDLDRFDYVQFMDDSYMMSVEGKRRICNAITPEF